MFNTASLIADMQVVDAPKTNRVSIKDNPFAGVILASKEDGKARQVRVPVGSEKRGTKVVEYVTTVKTSIRNAAYADGVGVKMTDVVEGEGDNAVHVVTFWGKEKTLRTRKAKDATDTATDTAPDTASAPPKASAKK